MGLEIMVTNLPCIEAYAQQKAGFDFQDIPFDNLNFITREQKFRITFKNSGEFPRGKHNITKQLFFKCADYLASDSLYIFAYKIDLVKRYKEGDSHVQKFNVYFEMAFVEK